MSNELHRLTGSTCRWWILLTLVAGGFNPVQIARAQGLPDRHDAAPGVATSPPGTTSEALAERTPSSVDKPVPCYLLPNFHDACMGWLVSYAEERNFGLYS